MTKEAVEQAQLNLEKASKAAANALYDLVKARQVETYYVHKNATRALERFHDEWTALLNGLNELI